MLEERERVGLNILKIATGSLHGGRKRSKYKRVTKLKAKISSSFDNFGQYAAKRFYEENISLL